MLTLLVYVQRRTRGRDENYLVCGLFISSRLVLDEPKNAHAEILFSILPEPLFGSSVSENSMRRGIL